MASDGAAGAASATDVHAAWSNAARATAEAEMEAAAITDFSNVFSFLSETVPKHMHFYNKLFLAIGAADFGTSSTHNLLDLFRYQLDIYKRVPKPIVPKITHFVLVIDPELKNHKLVEAQVKRINIWLKDDHERIFPDFKLNPTDRPNLFKSANRSVYYWFSPVKLVSDYVKGEMESIIDLRLKIRSMGVPAYAKSCVPKRESWNILFRICKETPFSKLYSYNCAFFDKKETIYKNGKPVEGISYKSNTYYEDICELLFILYETKKEAYILDRVMGAKIKHPGREEFKLYDFNLSPVLTKNRLNNTTTFLGGGKQTRRFKKTLKRRLTKRQRLVS